MLVLSENDALIKELFKPADTKPLVNVKHAERSHISRKNNNLGHVFENEINFASSIYKKHKTAVINKTPEPFQVKRKNPNGTFIGVFCSHAQPDYTGTLYGGQSVMFEAKATSTDTIKRSVLTDTQMEILRDNQEMGAFCFVLVQIQDRRFSVPFDEWDNMKEIYGRVSLKADMLTFWEIMDEPNNPLPYLQPFFKNGLL